VPTVLRVFHAFDAPTLRFAMILLPRPALSRFLLL
jgi:hypothetical protein